MSSSSVQTDSVSSSSETSSSAQEKSSSSETSSSSEERSSSSQSYPEFIDLDFYNGADISTVQEYERFGARFFDVDGTEKDIFTLLKDHGFNAIRLKTFVTPDAQYGYAAPGCDHDAEAYADKEHVIAYAKKAKAAGMALMINIHYSDNWADPAKQTIPSRWRSVKTSDEMADSVYNYTYDLLISLKQAGATPEFVQIGNETTPGILIHLPVDTTNCWGGGAQRAPKAISGYMGTTLGTENAVKYFNAGIRATKAVSQKIKTVLHIERLRNHNTINWWMDEIFHNNNVPADVMGLTAYRAYGDGDPESWESYFKALADAYPNLEFMITEYNGGDAKNHYDYDGTRLRTQELIRKLDRWIGLFFWEPTLNAQGGAGLFEWQGPDAYAIKEAFEEFK
jgi:arabinogalactan endo-1,4-beta-galactosidase